MHLNFWKRLKKDQSGTIIVELAYSMPIFMLLGMTGVETASLAVANLKVSQIAMMVTDNLSRAKQDVPLGLPQLREVDINDAFIGADLQSTDMEILSFGRVIVSSLQVNSSNGQWIAWQRCKGMKNTTSAYGTQGTGATGTAFLGMGSAPNRVTAPAGTAIIFTEVDYNYQPLIAGSLLGTRSIRKEAAYYVRDQRDLTGGPTSNGIYNPTPSATASSCSVFSAT
jgi:hypothetical protein